MLRKKYHLDGTEIKPEESTEWLVHKEIDDQGNEFILCSGGISEQWVKEKGADFFLK